MSKDGNYQISIRTEIGYIAIFSDGRAITEVKFDKKIKDNPCELLLMTKEKILKYLKGERVSFVNINLKIKEHRDFYNFIRKIPYGETKSYSDIGKYFKIHPRKVGILLSKNKIPIFIPCHRVIYKNGNLGGFYGGERWKNFLLKIERNNTL